MSDSPDLTNSVTPEGQAGSRAGDVPEAVRRRYLTERRLDGAVVYFTDATVVTPSFRDTGARLVAARSDPTTIRDLLQVAQHRGWNGIQVRGAEGFRREAWLQARALGLTVEGYRPRERDEQALARRREAVQRTQTPPERRPQPQRPNGLDLRDPRDRMRVVETVVRRRTVEPGLQAELLERARTRVAELERRRHQGRDAAHDRS
jgi:hypothetical protein